MSDPAFIIINFSARKTDLSICFLGNVFVYKLSYQKYEQRNIDYVSPSSWRLSGPTVQHLINPRVILPNCDQDQRISLDLQQSK